MSDFIKDFYYGNIEPQECTTGLTPKLSAAFAAVYFVGGWFASITRQSICKFNWQCEFLALRCGLYLL